MFVLISKNHCNAGFPGRYCGDIGSDRRRGWCCTMAKLDSSGALIIVVAMFRCSVAFCR